MNEPPNDEPIRVLLVDDHRVFSQALEVVLALQPDIRVVGMAGNGVDALQMVEEHEPHVVLLDYHMPGANGAMVTAQIKGDRRDTAVIILTASTDEDVMLAAAEAGASGFLTKNRAVEEVVDAVKRAHQGEMLIPRDAFERLAARSQAQPKVPESHRLTPRECEILMGLAEGADDVETAARLYISPHTLRTHIRNIMDKLGARSRLDALMLAFRQGYIDLPR